VAVSAAVRRYFAERILAASGRDRAPHNVRPLPGAATGRAVVEGCRGGGKNVLELSLVADAERVLDVSVSCGLCNPAMVVAADVVADWARGQRLSDLLALDVGDPAALDPLFSRAGAPERPEDLREKAQYALHALRRAVLDHQGLALPPLPDVPAPLREDP
jgi:hypothetical protein